MSSKKNYVLLVGGVIGAFAYLSIYGFGLLNVTNEIWLYDKYDLTQHYAGWLFFRNSKWYFPIGMMNTVTYPDLYSVVYTDAIPLFAIFFKLLSPVLPSTFQYFGIWGLFCFIMQGIIASNILKRFFDSNIMIAIGVLFFVYSPWVIQRLYAHSSLAAHWLLLLCILNSLKTNELSLKTYTLQWCFLLALAASIHVYFIPMCMIFLGCNMLYRIWKTRKNIRIVLATIAVTCLPVISAAMVLWLLGAFSSSALYNSGGFGDASANLNFLFNSMGKSKFFAALPQPYTKWPDESFGYLGLGGFILLFAAVIRIILDKEFRKKIWVHRSAVLITCILIFICVWLATSPSVILNDTPLFRWLMPRWVENLLGIFRSLGRFVWPICYILLLCGVVSTGYNKGKLKIVGISLLSVCMLLQLIEFKDYIITRSTETNAMKGYKDLDSGLWDRFIDDYDHIYNFDGENWKDIAMYAGNHQLTLNQTYLSRINWQTVFDDMAMEEEKIWRGEGSLDTLYLFPLSWEMDTWWRNLPDINIYKNSGFYIGSLNPIEELQEFQIH